MACDVFISHSVKDKRVADAVVARLEAESVRCWVAPRDVVPGADWGESIINAIESSRIMILIFSRNANSSPQIKREVERAVNKETYIIPFRVDDTAPTRSLEYFISSSQWMDAFPPPLEGHIDRLAKTVTAVLANVPSPKESLASGEGMPAQSQAESSFEKTETAAAFVPSRESIPRVGSESSKGSHPRPTSRSWITIAGFAAVMIAGAAAWYFYAGMNSGSGKVSNARAAVPKEPSASTTTRAVPDPISPAGGLVGPTDPAAGIAANELDRHDKEPDRRPSAPSPAQGSEASNPPATGLSPLAQPEPQIYSQGELTVRGTWMCDLDLGKETTEGADFWWSQETGVRRYLAPQNGARFNILGTRDYASLSFVDLQRLKYSPQRIDGSKATSNQIPQGTVVAFRTKEGRLGKFRVEEYGYNLVISWVTYSAEN
jgi:hypothetical protein